MWKRGRCFLKGGFYSSPYCFSTLTDMMTREGHDITKRRAQEICVEACLRGCLFGVCAEICAEVCVEASLSAAP